MTKLSIERSDGRMFAPPRSDRTISTRSMHKLDTIVARGIHENVEALRRANQTREAGDTVVEFKQTSMGQSRREFPQRP